MVLWQQHDYCLDNRLSALVCVCQCELRPKGVPLVVWLLKSMPKNKKIYIAGHRGFVGSAIVRRLQKEGYENLLLRTRAELNLTDKKEVENFFATEKPAYVFLAAAKVGGIHANDTQPADFIYDNLAIQNNVLHAASEYQVEKLLFLGSSCIYPRLAPQPMREEHLLSGPLEPTNSAYAIAKDCWDRDVLRF